MYRKLSAEEQISKMNRLINFGKVNETKSSAPIVELKKKAANGKTYGIIRENAKFYIVEAPEKDTEVLAEDFSYIGGFNNRKENEYKTYAKAANALDLKLMAINETVAKKDRVLIEQPKQTAEWETQITESMRKEIDRFKEVTSNVAYIIAEDKSSVPSAHTLPEAPASHPSDKKVNAPFTDTSVAKGDKDFKEKETNYKKAGAPFNVDGEADNKDMQSDKTPGNGADDGVYCEAPKYVDTGVAGQHPKGGTVVRLKENKEGKIRMILTEEQVLAWNDNKNYMDKSHGTEVGSSAPFTDEVGEASNQTEADTDKIHESEGVAVHNTDNQNSPTPGTSKVGDGQPFEVKVNEDVTADDAAGLPDEEDFSEYPFPEQAEDDYGTKFDNDFAEFEDGEGGDELPEIEIVPDEDEGPSDAEIRRAERGIDPDWEKNWNKFDDDEDFYFQESAQPVYEFVLTEGEEDGPNDAAIRRANRGLNFDKWNEIDDEDGDTEYYPWESVVRESKLNDFGKHPAYRKVPMTLPANKEVAINGAREWDDESAQGEEPFGQQIGDSAPFTQVVDKITESLMATLYGNNKKKV